MGTSKDDRFEATGSLGPYVPVWNYMASGSGEVGYTTWSLNDTFRVGGAFNGKEFGVLGLTGPYGDLSLFPPLTNYADPSGTFGASALYTGVAGLSTYSSGVYGHKSFPDEDTRSIPLGHHAGVVGTGISWPGVFGWSTRWHGVEGITYSGEAAVIGRAEQGRGVFGICGSGTVSGVEGRCGDAGPTIPNFGNVAGVSGSSDARPGVIGTSNTQVGIYGFSQNSLGVLGQTMNPASYAGFFLGNLVVTGQIFAGIKDAIVPFPDGTQRLLHCMESPEHWFEDFGSARLKHGRATVKLDADFAKVITVNDYRVFLTPEGDCQGLYYVRKRGQSFEVRELQGGTSSIAFSYRIVGRRKDIREQRRFAKIDARLSLPAAPPRKPTAAGLRAFVARVEREARKRTPKVAKKARRSRELRKYLTAGRRIVAPPRLGERIRNKK